MTTAITHGLASMKFGVWQQPLNMGGKSIAVARQELNQLWNVPNDATAYKDKVEVSDDYVIQAGDTIEFSRRSGEKG